jgi:hypothetical protein
MHCMEKMVADRASVLWHARRCWGTRARASGRPGAIKPRNIRLSAPSLSRIAREAIFVPWVFHKFLAFFKLYRKEVANRCARRSAWPSR